jgi:hypothetical protein
MRMLFVAALVGFAASAAMVVAQPNSEKELARNPATLCLDPGGVSYPPVCTKMNASRFASPPDICHCNGPYRKVDAPWCAPGEHPPADNAAFDRARAKAALDNTLFGDTYEGKRMCVPLDGRD